MKFTTLVLGLVFSLAASAAEVQVMLIDNAPRSSSGVSSTFGLNKELGRAWVETVIDNRIDADTELGRDEYRQKAEGLSFDVNTSEVVLDIEGARVVCATVRTVGRSIFRHDKMKLTGNCQFKHDIRTVIVDDGFETYKKKQTLVSIVVE